MGSNLNPFQFHFGWNRRITDKPIEMELPIPQNYEEEEEQVLRVNYGEGITEMRLYNDNIDYKVNFDEEAEC